MRRCSLFTLDRLFPRAPFGHVCWRGGALFLLAVLALAPQAQAQELSPRGTGGQEFLRVIHENGPWGYLLVSLSVMILLLIFFCMRNAGNAYRSGSGEAFAALPKRLDPEGLQEFHEQAGRTPAGGPLRRALQVGLVSGRGGLLISKSAVLAAWEAERSRYRLWPSLMLAAGMVSLALAMLAGAHLLSTTLNFWEESVTQDTLPDRVMFLPIRQAYILGLLGLTNFFIGLLLYFLFDRITVWFLNRTTGALVDYLGSAADAPHTDFTAVIAERKAASEADV